MNIYCDNYATCNGMLVDQGGGDETNETYARAKGWHIYHGTSMGGSLHEGVLCTRCVGAHRRALSPPPPLLPGQVELFEIVAIAKNEPAP